MVQQYPANSQWSKDADDEDNDDMMVDHVVVKDDETDDDVGGGCDSDDDDIDDKDDSKNRQYTTLQYTPLHHITTCDMTWHDRTTLTLAFNF